MGYGTVEKVHPALRPSPWRGLEKYVQGNACFTLWLRHPCSHSSWRDKLTDPSSLPPFYILGNRGPKGPSYPGFPCRAGAGVGSLPCLCAARAPDRRREVPSGQSRSCELWGLGGRCRQGRGRAGRAGRVGCGRVGRGTSGQVQVSAPSRLSLALRQVLTERRNRSPARCVCVEAAWAPRRVPGATTTSGLRTTSAQHQHLREWTPGCYPASPCPVPGSE